MIGFSALDNFHNVLGIKSYFKTPFSTSYISYFHLFIFRALPFFCLGIYFRLIETKIRNLPSVLFRKDVFSCLLALGGVLSVWERFNFHSSQYYLGTYIIFILLCLFSIKYSDWNNKMLNFIGNKLSLNVYVYHIAIGWCVSLLSWKYRYIDKTFFASVKGFVIVLATLLVTYMVYNIKSYLKYSKKMK
ncbi:hypothetical protein SAMN05216245_105118 [Succiniclasticum ruminis DSM 9236]|uniref:Acyltransferase family protein n=1 Tax=Succiniclasticum ruminis DSM 9236 TaxID=1123323 RepID=A0A1I2AAP8_9FIRM|nr:hypothetical protein SAMN05216245_105118 [Succiniclasticum ruminis DSM 9236]